MKRKFTGRERALLGIAITLYEKLGNSTSKNLEQLNVECLLLKVALVNVTAIRGKLATSGIDKDIDLTHDLRLTARDAIELTFQKAEKVKDAQQDLLIPVEATEEYEYELRALRRAFADQSSMPLDDRVTLSVDGAPPVPLDSPEAEKEMRKAVRKSLGKGDQPGAPPPP